ncbi:hypothetical protein XMV201_002925 [Aliiroseovarius sp. xm-v-201]|uniref:hypothetical protein n=1 Tax=unclassified Aliiroseovarius TaxID=2623558 RepID=UPI00156819DC|nr:MULTISPECIES: hypothetical protein [unclassified Aliiroseovarius]NRP51145.1 hypothetical protein [Aliiroseovarius sp. xm-m-354]NRQ05897.1 hypothetical protein [Aliiroseovarius sp. xm-m-309]NRQ09101.1 hypothetical protein [Aliiroseovarius sp. xm-v-201]
MSPLDVSNWGETLKLFVENFGSIPPREAYHAHPVFTHLMRAIEKRRCVFNKHFAAGEANSLLRKIVRDGDILFIDGYCSQEEVDNDIAETIAFYRANPQMRGKDWTFQVRRKRLIADLLSDQPPKCPLMKMIWLLIREHHIPDIDDFTTDIEWTR